MQRKSTKQSRGANRKEKEFIVWTKNRSCAYCGNPGPSRYDHCAGSAAKIKIIGSVHIGHYFGVAECSDCAELTHSKKYETFGPHHKIWLSEIEEFPGEIPPEIIIGITEYGTRYHR